jgi:hypothetical protein
VKDYLLWTLDVEHPVENGEMHTAQYLEPRY